MVIFQLSPNNTNRLPYPRGVLWEKGSWGLSSHFEQEADPPLRRFLGNAAIRRKSVSYPVNLNEATLLILSVTPGFIFLTVS